MRQIVLDTETTGLETSKGHRIVEIGCLELEERRPTGQTLHLYLNPERDMDEDALKVHGITQAFLADKPLFADIAGQFLDFVQGAELIIHNAPFDIGFLDHELKLTKHKDRINDHCSVLDTLVLAKRMHPGQRNSLDALCRRYGIDNSNRELHGALLDAQLLADVYLHMTGGQTHLFASDDDTSGASTRSEKRRFANRQNPRVVTATSNEQQDHADYIKAMGKGGEAALWGTTT